jgi:hypothetical protein
MLEYYGVTRRLEVGGWRREWEFIIEDSSAESAFPQTSLCSLAHHNTSNIRQFKNKDKDKDKDKDKAKREAKKKTKKKKTKGV